MDGLGNAFQVDAGAEQAPQPVHPKNKLNDLTAPQWINRTVSVFVQKGHGKNSREAIYEREHPAPFSYTDIIRFVDFFSKAGETVLDPFCGIGSTLKACAVTGRNGLGVELSPRFAALARERLQAEVDVSLLGPGQQTVIEGDARAVLPTIEPGSVGLLVTSPPYWGILNKVDHKARQERLALGKDHNYGDDAADLAHIEDYGAFVAELGRVFELAAPAIRPKRYAVVIVGDFRHKERYHMFHSDLAAAMEARGSYALRGITIIHQKFKRVFPYGYPHSYVPNIHHQYAMVFQRVGEPGRG